MSHTIDIVDAQLTGIFDSATIRAVEHFRFAPYIENGVPTEVSNVQYRFEYSL